AYRDIIPHSLTNRAVGIVRSKVPPPSDKVIRQALEWALGNMLSYGITSFVVASNGFVAGSEREAKLYAQLADEKILKQRIRLCLNWRPEAINSKVIAERQKYEREGLQLDCVKLFMDGVPTDSHTAAMLAPYSDTIEGRDDEASRYGLLLFKPEEVNDIVTRADKQGLTVKFHAAGDAAVRAGLDAIEAARKANGMNKLWHNVGHSTFISKGDLGRAKALHAAFELSPYLWSPSPINDDITKATGAERIKRVWPFREVIDAGAPIVAGSDWAVVPSVNPWLAIEALVTRELPGGSEKSFGKPQAISLREAIELFTVNAAKHMGMQGKLGKLSEGMLADLIVLDRDPFSIPATELHKVTVTLTMVNGKIAYQTN
ncbi:MAG: amidohydrolase family protein, partial [Pseudomonadota bacterium]